MKKYLSLILTLCMVLSLCACGQKAPTAEPAAPAAEPAAPAEEPAAPAEEDAEESGLEKTDKLVVYSPGSDSMIDLFIPAFEAEYGVSIELITGNTGELLSRIDAEKESPIADVLFCGSMIGVSGYEDLFENYTSKNNEDIVEAYRNNDGCYTIFTIAGSVLLVNTDLAGDIEINGYEDLLNPELNKMVALGNAAASSSAFDHLTMILQDFSPEGEYESEEAWEFVGKLLDNSVMLDSSGAIYKGAAEGEYTVALTWEDPACTYLFDGATNLKVVYPEEGEVYSPGISAIIKNAPNMYNAQLFMDFITSKVMQDRLGQETCIRPVRVDVELGAHMLPLDQINTKEQNIEWILENKPALQAKFTEVATEIYG